MVLDWVHVAEQVVVNVGGGLLETTSTATIAIAAIAIAAIAIASLAFSSAWESLDGAGVSLNLVETHEGHLLFESHVGHLVVLEAESTWVGRCVSLSISHADVIVGQVEQLAMLRLLLDGRVVFVVASLVVEVIWVAVGLAALAVAGTESLGWHAVISVSIAAGADDSDEESESEEFIVHLESFWWLDCACFIDYKIQFKPHLNR